MYPAATPTVATGPDFRSSGASDDSVGRASPPSEVEGLEPAHVSDDAPPPHPPPVPDPFTDADALDALQHEICSLEAGSRWPRTHHRKLHEGGWGVHFAGRRPHRVPLFVDPWGGFHAEPGRGGRAWTDEVRERVKEVPKMEHAPETDGMHEKVTNPSRSPGEEAQTAEEPPTTEAPPIRLVPRPSAALPADPLQALMGDNRSHGPEPGLDPDDWSLWASYERAADIPWIPRARAFEALDEAHFGE